MLPNSRLAMNISFHDQGGQNTPRATQAAPVLPKQFLMKKRSNPERVAWLAMSV
jgi:hypothetical protein